MRCNNYWDSSTTLPVNRIDSSVGVAMIDCYDSSIVTCNECEKKCDILAELGTNERI